MFNLLYLFTSLNFFRYYANMKTSDETKKLVSFFQRKGIVKIVIITLPSKI